MRESDPNKCYEFVSDGGRWPHFHQCTKPVMGEATIERPPRDTIIAKTCKIHHPDYIAEKRKQQEVAWRNKMDRAPMYSKIHVEKLNAKIAELEAVAAEVKKCHCSHCRWLMDQAGELE